MSEKQVILSMEEYERLVKENNKTLAEIQKISEEIAENNKKGLYCLETLSFRGMKPTRHYEWSEPAEEIKKLQEENIELKKKLAIERFDRNELEELYDMKLGKNADIYRVFEEDKKNMSIIEFLKWRKS